MYRSVLALLFASVLLLSGCAVGQQTVPKEKSGQETNMDGLQPDKKQLMQSILASFAKPKVKEQRE